MSDTSPSAAPQRTAEVKRLCLFFALAYFAQGISQDKSGMLDQVLKFYFTKHQQMTSTQYADFIAPLILPWVIKPLYGLLSDLFPVGVYRRKSYLVLTATTSMLAFLSLFFVTGNDIIRICLFCAGFGIAFGDVLVDALMVENGQRTGFLRTFQGLQWMWISIAGTLAAVVGGQLTQHLAAPMALKVAVGIAALPMLALLFASLYLVKEAQTRLSREEVLRSVQGLGEAFKSPTLWKMALILFFTQFAPNAGVAWYTYETETLKIPQDAVGIEGAIGSIGGILGAILFNWKLSHVPPRRLLAMSLCASAAGTLCYLLVRGVSTLYPVAFIVGVLAMVALLSLLSLAGEACPKRAEGFTFAALMGLNNLAVQWGTQIGARIFDGTGKIIWPLILVSAGTTLLALIFLPLLPKTNVTPRADKEEDR